MYGYVIVVLIMDKKDIQIAINKLREDGHTATHLIVPNFVTYMKIDNRRFYKNKISNCIGKVLGLKIYFDYKVKKKTAFVVDISRYQIG